MEEEVETVGSSVMGGEVGEEASVSEEELLEVGTASTVGGEVMREMVSDMEPSKW